MWTHPGFETVSALFTARTGIVIAPDRAPHVEAAIRRAMVRCKVESVDELHERLVREPDLLDAVVRELVVGETYFFRDPSHFDFVRHTILPDVLKRRGERHVVRAWSAACSTGEEPYSLAIVFEEERVPDCSFVLATDISQKALDQARQAVYRPWSLRGEGAEIARKYLKAQDGRFVLDERIKRHVNFRHLNLVADDYPSAASGVWDMDVIFCRNVLIYFSPEAIAQVCQRISSSLVDGGYLIPGPSDPMLFGHSAFEPIVTQSGVFYRRRHGLSVDVPAKIMSSPSAASSAAHAHATSSHASSMHHAEVMHEPVVAPLPTPAPAHPVVVAELKNKPPLLDAACEALRQGDYRRAADLTWDLTIGAETSAIHVRALANLDAEEAETACQGALTLWPLSTELRYLHATLLISNGREDAAEQEVRRAIYLDRTLAVGHALLGMLLKRRGDLVAARRSFRNAYRICTSLAPETLITLGEGENAAMMARAVAAELAWLGHGEDTES